MNRSKSLENYSFQKIVVIVGITLFFIKLYAWYLTKSVAILTDALESTVNVFAAFFSLYSLYISSKPRDKNHPYGHGKIEFISAGAEGGLIIIAGIVIIIEASKKLYSGNYAIEKLDYGVILIAITAIMNSIVGFYAVKKGKKNNSLALIASGKHLLSDTYSTIGLIIGLIFVIITNFLWLDSTIALMFGALIIYTGIKIIRSSLAGIMDEADEKLIQKLVTVLEENRQENWVDIHNIRFIKFGSQLHLDCHLTLPWYFNIKEAHDELDKLEQIVEENFGQKIEMFVHSDGCREYSCKLCSKKDCVHRKHKFEKKIIWTKDNISLDKRHRI